MWKATVLTYVLTLQSQDIKSLGRNTYKTLSEFLHSSETLLTLLEENKHFNDVSLGKNKTSKNLEILYFRQFLSLLDNTT